MQWSEAVNFIPLAGELIIYDIDDTHSTPRFKIGDGIVVWNDEHTEYTITGTKVNDLPFVSDEELNIKNGSNYGLYQETEKDDNAVELKFTDLPIEDKTEIAGIYNRTITGKTAVAFGSSVASGSRSFAAGSSNIAKEEKAIALGCDNYANGKQSIAAGYANYTEGSSSAAIGQQNRALGNASIAMGYNCISGGDASLAVGTGAQAAGLYSVALGNKTKAAGDNQTVVGRFNKLDTEALFIVGNGENDDIRHNAFVVYKNGAMLNEQPVATSYFVNERISEKLRDFPVETRSPYSLVQTWYGETSNSATGYYASAFGASTHAEGENSNSMGFGTVASGNHSHSEGWNSVSEGDASHAENNSTKAIGDNSHSEGYNTQSIGNAAHSEGDGTKAEGAASHAQGTGSHAKGSYSSASGNQTRANYANQFVVGKFNNNKEGTLFEVGNGSKEDEIDENGSIITKNRSNAFEVYGDGHAELTKQGATDNSVVIKSGLKTINGNSIVGSGNIEITSGVIPDWNQADATQPDYIKNRTHYMEKAFEDIIWDGTKTDKSGVLGSYNSMTGLTVDHIKVSDAVFAVEDVIGCMVEVIRKDNGNSSIFTLTEENIVDDIERGAIVVTLDASADIGFWIVYDLDKFLAIIEVEQMSPIGTLTTGIYLPYITNSQTDMEEYVGQISAPVTVKKLDEKYLPELATVAKTGSYNDLIDRPEVTVEQIYDPTSINALSGKAVADAIDQIVTLSDNPVIMTGIATTDKAKVVVTKDGAPASGVEVVLSNGKEDVLIYDENIDRYLSCGSPSSEMVIEFFNNTTPVGYDKQKGDIYTLKGWPNKLQLLLRVNGYDADAISITIPTLNMGHTYRVDIDYAYYEDEDEYGNAYASSYYINNITIHEIVSEQHTLTTDENGEIDPSQLITPTCVCSVANGDPTYSITATYSTATLSDGLGHCSLAQIGCNAICDNNIALGVETTAGIRGFKIKHLQVVEGVECILDIGEGVKHYEIGDVVNLDISKHWYNRYKIIEKAENVDIDGVIWTGIIAIEAIYPDLYPVSEANLSLGDGDTDNWIWVEGKNVGQPIDQYTGAFAVGIKTFAAGYGAFAAGRQTKAIGNYSVALGRGTIADYASMAIGLNTHALGQESFAMGSGTKALSQCSAAFGGNTIARGKFAFVAGTGSEANGEYSAAFGNQTIAEGNNQFVVGLFNEVEEYPALFIVGNGTKDKRSNAFVVKMDGSATLGGKAVATIDTIDRLLTSANHYTDNKCAEISTTNNAKWNSFALQCDTKLGTIHQIGGSSTSPNPNNASVAGAIALGTGNTASGQYAVVLGGESTASGKFAFAAGTGNTASGADSVAFGSGSTASIQHALAQGWKSNATQPCAVAINCATTADGENSFTQGQRSKTTGLCAAAFNYYTQANGKYSTAFGNQSRANYHNQFVVGKFNDNKADTLFEVGNGSEETARSNAFEVGTKSTGEAFIRIGNVELTDTDLIKLKALIDNM